MHTGNLIKSIVTPRFYLDLFETDWGTYYIRYKHSYGEPEYSSNISDLNLALSIFEKKLFECEVH